MSLDRVSVRAVGAALAVLAALACASAPPKKPIGRGTPAAASTPAPTPPPAAPSAAATSVPAAPYRVGVGDVLEVVVFGNDDLSRLATVQTDGAIALPLVREVAVAGLTVDEVKQKLTSLLTRDYLVNPQVEVRVKEFHSQFVTVLGEVNAPGRKPLRGQTRLIDILVDSGGLTPRASGEIVITRADEGVQKTGHTMTVRLGGAALRPQDEIALQMRLQAGDIVSVAPKHYVTVEGEVVRPGRYPLDTDLTVSGAVSTAGGLTRFGSNDVKVRRIDSATTRTRILSVDLKAIRKGKAQDLVLQPNDVISIPRRRF